MTLRPLVISTIVVFFLGTVLTAQVARNHDVALKNWQAPLYWQPSQTGTEPATLKPSPELRTPSLEAAATTTGPLVFVAMTPCRVVDTRTSQMFPGPFGPPSLSPGPVRSFPIQSSTLCSIPSTAQAYSFNVTVVPPGSLGYLILWPEGQTQPTAVTLDDITGDIRNNAAIVPAGTPNGGISAVVNGNTDLVIDINGYYAAGAGQVYSPSCQPPSDCTVSLPWKNTRNNTVFTTVLSVSLPPGSYAVSAKTTINAARNYSPVAVCQLVVQTSSAVLDSTSVGIQSLPGVILSNLGTATLSQSDTIAFQCGQLIGSEPYYPEDLYAHNAQLIATQVRGIN